MKKEITLESIYELLTGFISRQESVNKELLEFRDTQILSNSRQEGFNSKQEAFNSRQEGFNSKQETFNSRQESFNSKQEAFNTRLEDRLDQFQEEEKANHNLSHRMIGQAFEHISDIEMHLGDRDKKWNVKAI